MTFSIHDLRGQMLGGDFNETAEKPRSGLLKLMLETGLLDPWTHRFPTHPTFNTYRRGSQRIDTILCSPSVLPLIQSISYSPFNWFTNSDHRAMIIDFSSINMFHMHIIFPIKAMHLVMFMLILLNLLLTTCKELITRRTTRNG